MSEDLMTTRAAARSVAASSGRRTTRSERRRGRARPNKRLRALVRAKSLRATSRRRLKRPAKPGRYGWPGPGGGEVLGKDVPPEFRGPTVQVAGLFPFSAGSSLPMVGAALGPHLEGRGIVCADPISWFIEDMILNPSAFVLGRPALGKSTLVRHILVQLPDKGIIPLVLSDMKGEYVDIIRELGGKVIAPGRGAAYVNPFDLGPLVPLLNKLTGAMRDKAVAEMTGRRNNVALGLCELALGSRLEAHEKDVLYAAVRIWETEHPGQVPIVRDVREQIRQMPEELRRLAQDRGEDERYWARTERLIDALNTLDEGGSMGGVFSRHTTEQIDLQRPVVFDMSDIDAADTVVQAGLQLVCWAYGSAQVAASKYLADAGLEERRTYLLVMDELWRALRAATFMVDRVDDITRLNRTLGMGQMLITHTMDDLNLDGPDGPGTKKAWGFVARSEMVFLGGLAPSEMGNLATAFSMSRKEQKMISAWSAKGKKSPDGKDQPPPGRGKFLLKTGQDTGIPFRVQLVEAERALNDTNRTWRDTADSMHRASSDLDDFDEPGAA